MCVLKLLQASGDDRHLVNLVSVAAAGQIVDRRIQTLQNRAVSSVAAQTLSDLVADVASLDRREDEGVSLACNRRALALGSSNDRRYSILSLQIPYIPHL